MFFHFVIGCTNSVPLLRIQFLSLPLVLFKKCVVSSGVRFLSLLEERI